MSETLRALGIALRPATPADLPFLLTLYTGFRALEMAMVPWPTAQKQAFVADQFRLQHHHFVTHFPQAGFWVVEQASPAGAATPIGRLYLDMAGPLWGVVDIGFLPERRGRGVGRTLLEWAQQSARAAGAEGIDLQVTIDNPRARALYQRLGFRAEGEREGFHQRMVWTSV